MSADYPKENDVQLSYPRPCPDCDNGKKPSGKLCITCRGSGRVHLVPAERERDPETAKLFEKMWSVKQEDIYE